MNTRFLAGAVALVAFAPLTACVPIGGCGDGNPDPFVGTWELHRTLDQPSGCPAFVIPATANVGIDRDAEGFLVDSADLVGTVDYVEPLEGAYGTLRFSLSEGWVGSNGAPIDAVIDYELTDDGFSIMGVAHTTIVWESTTCDYDWSIHSI